MVKIVAVFRSLHLSAEFEIIFKIANKNISDVWMKLIIFYISAILLFILHTFQKCVSNLFTDNRFIIVFKRSYSLILQ